MIGLYELLDLTIELIEPPESPLTLVFLITTLIHFGLGNISTWPGRFEKVEDGSFHFETN